MDIATALPPGISLLFAALIVRNLRKAAPADDRRSWTIASASFLLAWWIVVVLAAQAGLLRALPTSAFPMLLLGWIPALLIVALWKRHDGFRLLVDRIPANRLVEIQSVRLVGIAMLWSAGRGELPWLFALPAGLGGVATGVLAPWVAQALSRGTSNATRWARWWNALGLADIVLAMFLGGLTGPGPHQALSLDFPSASASAFPLVVTPAFLVPLAILAHAASLRSLARHHAQRS